MKNVLTCLNCVCRNAWQRVLQGAGEGGPSEVIKQVAPVALPSPGLVVDLGEAQVDYTVSGEKVTPSSSLLLNSSMARGVLALIVSTTVAPDQSFDII